jgi:hypothetical protein
MAGHRNGSAEAQKVSEPPLISMIWQEKKCWQAVVVDDVSTNDSWAWLQNLGDRGISCLRQTACHRQEWAGAGAALTPNGPGGWGSGRWCNRSTPTKTASRPGLSQGR